MPWLIAVRKVVCSNIIRFVFATKHLELSKCSSAPLHMVLILAGPAQHVVKKPLRSNPVLANQSLNCDAVRQPIRYRMSARRLKALVLTRTGTVIIKMSHINCMIRGFMVVAYVSKIWPSGKDVSVVRCCNFDDFLAKLQRGYQVEDTSIIQNAYVCRVRCTRTSRPSLVSMDALSTRRGGNTPFYMFQYCARSCVLQG